MTVGLPRAGKSTWVSEQGYPIVNPDSIRISLHGTPYINSAEPYIWAIARTMTEALFLAGHETVILDATNITEKGREKWIATMWKRKFKIFRTSKNTCIKRAEQIHRDDLVPVIERMAEQFEPVTKEERKL